MEEKVIDLRSVFSDILKNIVFIILVSAVIMLSGQILIKAFHKPVYETKLSYVVTSTDSATASNSAIQNKLVHVFKELIESNTLKKAIVADMGYKGELPAEITSEILQDETGDYPKDTNVIIVTVTASTPDNAFKVACAIQQNCLSVSDYINDNAVLTLLEEPRMSETDSDAVNVFKTDLLLFAAGFFIMCCIVAFVSVQRDTIKSSDEIRDKLGVSLLSSVPDVSAKGKKAKNGSELLITDKHVGFYYIENVKKTGNKIERMKKPGECMSMFVTSVMPGEGKTSIAANLALSLAMHDNKVLLIDLDLKKPEMFRLFGGNDKDPEFTDFLRGKKSLMETLKKKDRMPLWLMLQRKSISNSSALISSTNVRKFLEYAKSQFDFVIIDTAAVSSSADAEILAGMVSNAVLVVKQDTAKTETVNGVIDMLGNNGCNLLGCVYNADTNNTKSSDSYHKSSYNKYNKYNKSGYGYGYGYGKYSKTSSSGSKNE